MPLYFRSDTRSPEEIFKKGFSPRVDKQEDWVYYALYFSTDLQKKLSYEHAQDANLCYCICMSTKMESTTIFPIDDSIADTYIYVMSLPEAIKVKYDEKGKAMLDLTPDSSPDIKNIIVDLHSLQTTQAGLILENQRKANQYPTLFCDQRKENSNLFAGWALYAYEAVAHHVPTENIICAIKCTRENTKASEITYTNSNIKESLHPPYTDFKLGGNIILNNEFKPGDGRDQNDALNLVNELKDKDSLKSPNIYYGLGGKAF